jgi:hypothetical protein
MKNKPVVIKEIRDPFHELRCKTLTWLTFKDGTKAVYADNIRTIHMQIDVDVHVTLNIIPEKTIIKKTNKTYLQWKNRWAKEKK